MKNMLKNIVANKVFAWILLVIFAPVGIFLLYKFKHHGPKLRAGLTVVFALIFLFRTFGGHGDQPAQPSASEQPAVSQSVSTPAPAIPAKAEPQEVTLDVPDHEFSQSNSFDLFGTTEAGAKVVVTNAAGKVLGSPAVTAQGTFIQKVNVKDIGDHQFTITATKDGMVKNSMTQTVTREQSDAEKLAELKANAKTIPYKKLKKDADALAGKSIKVKGQVLEIAEKDGTTRMRLAVTKDSFGYNFNDVVWIEYSGHLDVYDDDVVTAYGTVYGNFSYKSQAGWDITIPAVLAQVVTK